MFLDRGRVAAEGTHAGLLATVPAYAEVLAQVAATEADAGPGPGTAGVAT